MCSVCVSAFCVCCISPGPSGFSSFMTAYIPPPAARRTAAPMPAIHSLFPGIRRFRTSGSSLTACRISSYCFLPLSVQRPMILVSRAFSQCVSPGTTSVHASMNCIVLPNPNRSAARICPALLAAAGLRKWTRTALCCIFFMTNSFSGASRFMSSRTPSPVTTTLYGFRYR